MNINEITVRDIIEVFEEYDVETTIDRRPVYAEVAVLHDNLDRTLSLTADHLRELVARQERKPVKVTLRKVISYLSRFLSQEKVFKGANVFISSFTISLGVEYPSDHIENLRELEREYLFALLCSVAPESFLADIPCVEINDRHRPEYVYFFKASDRIAFRKMVMIHQGSVSKMILNPVAFENIGSWADTAKEVSKLFGKFPDFVLR